MVLPISSAIRGIGMYDIQKIYGERLRSYKSDRPTVHVQNDSVTVSAQALESLNAHRKLKGPKKPIVYSNPRISNSPLNSMGTRERELTALYNASPFQERRK